QRLRNICPYRQHLIGIQKNKMIMRSIRNNYGPTELLLFEAANVGSPIIVADCKYSHAVLNNYTRAECYPVMNSKMLAERVIRYIEEQNKLEIHEI
ncbi:MAG: hypothetical protein RR710_07820, partial [Oscillospiraceae bacterium]